MLPKVEVKSLFSWVLVPGSLLFILLPLRGGGTLGRDYWSRHDMWVCPQHRPLSCCLLCWCGWISVTRVNLPSEAWNELQHALAPAAFSTASRRLQGWDACTRAGTVHVWEPSMGSFRSLAVTAVWIAGVSPAHCPNNIVSFSLVASTLPLVTSRSTPLQLISVRFKLDRVDTWLQQAYICFKKTGTRPKYIGIQCYVSVDLQAWNLKWTLCQGLISCCYRFVQVGWLTGRLTRNLHLHLKEWADTDHERSRKCLSRVWCWRPSGLLAK